MKHSYSKLKWFVKNRSIVCIGEYYGKCRIHVFGSRGTLESINPYYLSLWCLTSVPLYQTRP